MGTLPTDAAMTAKAHERARETKRAVRSGGGSDIPGDMIQVAIVIRFLEEQL